MVPPRSAAERPRDPGYHYEEIDDSRRHMGGHTVEVPNPALPSNKYSSNVGPRHIFEKYRYTRIASEFVHFPQMYTVEHRLF